MKNLTNTVNGQAIPVVANYETKPLLHLGKPVINGNGRQLTDDEWIYVDGHAINTVRANYCAMLNLKQITIKESVGEGKLMDSVLTNFIEKYTDKLVFTYYGKTYRVFLKKVNRRKFTIAKIAPYWATTDMGCNVPIMANGKMLMYAHELNLLHKFI